MVYFTSHDYGRVYYAKLWSNSCLTCGFFAIIIFILPFFLAYSTNNFWLGNQIYYEKPTVTLLNNMIMFVKQGDKTYTFSDQMPYFYSDNKLRSPLLQVESEISNFDGKADIYHITISFVPEKPVGPSNVQLIVFLDYQLQETVKMEMKGLAQIKFESSSEIGSAYAIGEVLLKQSVALSSGTVPLTVYNTSIFDEIFENSYNIMNVLSEYQARNQTTYFKYQTFLSPAQGVNHTEIKVDLMIPKHQKILYEPNFFEYVKNAWVQYFSLLVPIYLAFTWLLVFFYRYKLMHVFVVEDKEMINEMKAKQ